MATYRYKKKVGKHRMRDADGVMRPLRPGEVVELTDEQFRACKDKFEPTDELHGPSSAELRAMADAKEKEEHAAAEAKAKVEAEKAKAEGAKAKADKDKTAAGAKG